MPHNYKPCATSRFRKTSATGVLFLCLELRRWCWLEAVGALEGEHPAGVLGRQGAYLVELLDLVSGEVEVHGSDVVLGLVEALGSDDDGGDDGLREQPCERDAGGAAVVGLRDGSQGVEDLPVPPL